MTTTYQHQAATIVDEQLARLRGVLAEAQARLAATTSDLRQIGRTLDELRLRSVQSDAHALVLRQVRQLEERQQALERETLDLRLTASSIEQLIRQIEMSSAALTDHTAQIDPWVLALKAQIIQGREDERTRLAREIHDGPAQDIAHALLGLEHSITLAQQGDRERLLELLSYLRDSSRSALHEIRRFIADLRPPALEHYGLAAAIRELCGRFEAAALCSVRCEGLALPELPPEQAIVLYRIVQEALNNAAKHARGSAVTVRYGATEERLVVMVSDDGPGFDGAAVARRTHGKHWGFASMHERAELIGAQLQVTSAEGKGTTVRVTLGIEQATGKEA